VSTRGAIRPGVSGVVRDGDGRLLLQQRTDIGLWGLPGGAVEYGECVTDALRREVEEETGLTIDVGRLIGVYSDPAHGQIVTYPDGNVTHFADPAVVGALQYWVDLSKKDKVMPEGTVEWGTLRENFLQGKTAMMWHSTGNLTAVKDNAKFDFGVAMLPASKRRGTPTGGGNFYIFKKSTPEERKAALTFIRWMTDPERTAQWSIATGYIGTRPDAYQTKLLKDYVASFPPAAVARDQLEFATAELSTYQTGRVRKLLDDAIQAALTGGKTPKAALTEAQAQSERLLKPYR